MPAVCTAHSGDVLGKPSDILAAEEEAKKKQEEAQNNTSSQAETQN